MKTLNLFIIIYAILKSIYTLLSIIKEKYKAKQMKKKKGSGVIKTFFEIILELLKLIVLFKSI
jgi:hypothetical protein